MLPVWQLRTLLLHAVVLYDRSKRLLGDASIQCVPACLPHLILKKSKLNGKIEFSKNI